MLRVAPDASTIERTMKDLYPGDIKVVEWEKCSLCDKDVDLFIYSPEGKRQGFCFTHAQ